MIRLMTSVTDYSNALDLIQAFLCESSYSQGAEASLDRQHLGVMLHRFMQSGWTWIAYKNDQPVGILVSIVEPNVWSPRHRQYRELIWYVRPEERKSLVGGKLFIEYCRQGEKLLSENEISAYFTTCMSTTDSIDYQRRGFRLTESTYIKEK